MLRGDVTAHQFPKIYHWIHHFRLTTLVVDEGEDLEIAGTTANLPLTASVPIALHRALSILVGCGIPE